jgi:hypothetical protein
MNWLQYYTYLWCEYLSDGDIQLNDISAESITFQDDKLYHGTQTHLLGTAAGYISAGTRATNKITAANASDFWAVPIPVRNGDRLAAVQVYFKRAGGTVVLQLIENDLVGGAGTVIDTISVVSGTTATVEELDAGNLVVDTTKSYQVVCTAGATNDEFYTILYAHDRVAP